jgi:hypothetical protein
MISPYISSYRRHNEVRYMYEPKMCALVKRLSRVERETSLLVYPFQQHTGRGRLLLINSQIGAQHTQPAAVMDQPNYTFNRIIYRV